MRQRIDGYRQWIDELVREHPRYLEAVKKLDADPADPADPEANLIAGRFRWFGKGVARTYVMTDKPRHPPTIEFDGACHRIPLEMCPVSNVRTKAVRCVAEHPIRQYFQAGVPVTVNTDDPKMFQTSLAEEYRLLEQECGFTKAEICKLILTAIEASWLPEDRKTKLKSDFTGHAAWQGP